MSARRRLVLVVAILLGIAGSAGPIAIVLGAARGESAFGDSETTWPFLHRKLGMSTRLPSTWIKP